MFVIPDIYAVDCARDIFIKHIYERFYCVKKGDIVVDAGAHVGMFTIKASYGCGARGKVISVEPVDDNFKLLEKNVTLHKLGNVTIIKKALWSKKGKAKFLITYPSGTHQLKDVPKMAEFQKKEVEVETTTLDDITESMVRVDFLKIDCEGAELEILKGATKTLKVTKYIAMETHNAKDAEEIERLLKNCGFVVKVIGNMLYAKSLSYFHYSSFH